MFDEEREISEDLLKYRLSNAVFSVDDNDDDDDDDNDKRTKHERTTSDEEAIHIYLLEQPVLAYRQRPLLNAIVNQLIPY